MKSQLPNAELVESLIIKVQDLRNQNEQLRSHLRTSDDEASFMDTLSEAVKICDSKAENLTGHGAAVKKQAAAVPQPPPQPQRPIRLVNDGHAQAEYGLSSSDGLECKHPLTPYFAFFPPFFFSLFSFSFFFPFFLFPLPPPPQNYSRLFGEGQKRPRKAATIKIKGQKGETEG